MYFAGWFMVVIVELKDPAKPAPRVLLISGGTSDVWQRLAAGASAAARELGVTLQVAFPSSDGHPEEQIAFVRDYDLASVDGVALCLASPDSQIDLINDLAKRTRLITVGKECMKSKRLSNVGFSAYSAGRLVARSLYNTLPDGGTLVLLDSHEVVGAAGEETTDRIEGFKRERSDAESCPSARHLGLIDMHVSDARLDSSQVSLIATLLDIGPVYLIAVDNGAAEAAASVLTSLPEHRHLAMVVFDATVSTLDAIAADRVVLSTYADPYRMGYEAVRRLHSFSKSTVAELPVPGCGSECLRTEIVDKINLAAIRQRLCASSLRG
jgi:ribose transport system substrate-binding protein